MKTKIVTLYVFLLTCLVSSAQTPISDALVHEIITECVSKTGGFIIKQETKDNNDRETQIALPNNFSHYEITKALSPLMIDIENYYHSLMPWKVLDNGYLCNFNLAKDGSNRTLSMVYLPDNHILYISDSPSNSPKLTLPTSFDEKLQGAVVWSSVNMLKGFIREQKVEDLSSVDKQYQVAIQLQDNATATSIITDLKPLTTMLETTYYLGEPWKQDENGVLECEYFVQLTNENKNMFIHFYFFPKPHVLLINFITRPT
ncbi:MAG: hypothetical protein PUA78_01695 [Porphyromonadaceae bacterium]|nr:hypothetical protein [Porphyromonadaceae bacterium]